MLQFAGQAGFNPQTQSRLPLFDYRPAGMSQSGPKLVFSFFFFRLQRKALLKLTGLSIIRLVQRIVSTTEKAQEESEQI